MIPPPRPPLARPLLRRWLRTSHAALHPYPPAWVAASSAASSLALAAVLVLSLVAIPLRLDGRSFSVRLSLPAAQTPLAALGAAPNLEVEYAVEVHALWTGGGWEFRRGSIIDALIDPGVSGPALTPQEVLPGAPPTISYAAPTLRARVAGFERDFPWWRYFPVRPGERQMQLLATELALGRESSLRFVAYWQYPPYGLAPAAALGLAGLFALRRRRESRRRKVEHAASAYSTRRCPECDYPIEGLTSGRCPECGWDHARRQEELALLRRRYRR